MKTLTLDAIEVSLKHDPSLTLHRHGTKQWYILRINDNIYQVSEED